MPMNITDTVYTEKYIIQIEKEYQDLLNSISLDLSDRDKLLIQNAYKMARYAHRNQARKSGEPYIFHPIAVARIVAEEIGLGPTAIAAALIHDVVEDSEEHSLIDIELNFGSKVRDIIDGLTKIPKIKGEDVSNQARNIRKIMLTLIDDPRVVFVKLADRLHNMRTMDAQKPSSQKRISSITQYVFIPLAHRMGLYTIKSELEDLCLKYLDNEVYQEIVDKLDKSNEERQEYIQRFVQTIKERLLDKTHLVFDIKGRPKSIYSIYQKMQRQEVNFEQVYDKLAVRVIIDMAKSYPKEEYISQEKIACYTVLSQVTDLYKPNERRFRNFLANKKSNGYQSIHTTVLGPGKRWVEVQIRTQRMDDIAEKGLASHWSYKETQNAVEDNKDIDSLNLWYKHIREHLENPERNEIDFLDDIKLSLYLKEISVYTPMGDVKMLPKGATVLDFAFDIHTELGAKCTGARVNGKMVPFSTQLENGDEVEILKSKNQFPKEAWLKLVKTSKAKNKIKSSLNIERKRIAELGQEILKRKMRTLKMEFSDKMLVKMQQFFKVKTTQDLFYKVGHEEIDNKKLREFKETQTNTFVKYLRNPFRAKNTGYKAEAKQFEKPLIVFGDNQTKLDYTFTKCCNPLPGDEVFGLVTVSGGMKIHASSCPNAPQIRASLAHRIREASWIDSADENFEANVEISGIDQVGLVNQVTQVISNALNVDIRGINIKGDHGLFKGEITLVVKSKNHLNLVMERLKSIEGIKKVTRL